VARVGESGDTSQGWTVPQAFPFLLVSALVDGKGADPDLGFIKGLNRIRINMDDFKL
jgi:hypothetical protein